MAPPTERSLRCRLESQKYTFLLLGLGFCLFSPPLLSPYASSRLTTLVFLVLIAAALHASISSRAQGLVGLALGLPAALVVIGSAALPDVPALYVVVQVSLAALLAYTVFRIQRNIFAQETVEWDLVQGSVCVYLLLGVIWALVYKLMSLSDPGHFPAVVQMTPEEGSDFNLWFYFSIVTLTTLGYGDITPATSGARLLTSLEALIGQLYIALTIARIVGLHLAYRTRSQDSGGE